MEITTYDRVCSQRDIHRYLLQTSVVIAAFFVTSIVSQLFNLAAVENKTFETQAITQAEVNYYKKQDVLAPGEQLKWDIALAKLKSANKAIETNRSILGLNTALSDICFYLAPFLFILGLFAWLLHLPYVQVPSDD